MTETDKGSISQTKLWIIFTGIRKNPSPKYPDYQPLWSIPLPINQTRRGRMHETLFDRAALRRGKNNFFQTNQKVEVLSHHMFAQVQSMIKKIIKIGDLKNLPEERKIRFFLKN